MIKPQNETFYARIGENLTVECSALVDGSLHIQLLIITPGMKNETLTVLKKDTQFHVEDYHGSALRKYTAFFAFNNITRADFLSYACMTGNGVGFSTAHFTIKEKPPRPTIASSKY